MKTPNIFQALAYQLPLDPDLLPLNLTCYSWIYTIDLWQF